MRRLLAANCVIMGRLDVSDCIPLLDKVWGLAGKGIVGAHCCTGAVRAAFASCCASCAAVNSRRPSVLMPIRTLVADPVHFAVGLRLDEDVAKVGIAGMVPLALQQWAEQADTWTT